jgi:hypothetical protein
VVARWLAAGVPSSSSSSSAGELLLLLLLLDDDTKAARPCEKLLLSCARSLLLRASLVSVPAPLFSALLEPDGNLPCFEITPFLLQASFS